MKYLIAAFVSFVSIASFVTVPSDPGSGDWPMWGGTPDRNMVSNMKGLPIEWDVKTKKNIKWVAQLGSQSYGNPVVAGGMVFVGTNNEDHPARDDRVAVALRSELRDPLDVLLRLDVPLDREALHVRDHVAIGRAAPHRPVAAARIGRDGYERRD